MIKDLLVEALLLVIKDLLVKELGINSRTFVDNFILVLGINSGALADNFFIILLLFKIISFLKILSTFAISHLKIYF
jgi:hypothetical protein